MARVERELRFLLAATCCAAIITPLMSTMMNLALLGIGDEFGVGSHDLAYINTMFLLGSVFAMVPAAKFSSIKGMKKIFIIGHIILIAGCLFAIYSPSFWFLVAMRFVIGFGASMIAVTAMAMLSFVFPIEHRGRVMGFNTTFVYIGLSIGPTLGGLLTDIFGWRSIFVSIFFLSLIPVAAMSLFKREVRPTPDVPMDWTGSVLWGFTVIILMFGVINVTELWAKGLVIIGTVFLVIMLYYYSRTRYPALSISMFRNRVFSRACVAAFMNYGASYSITFFLALYLQSIGELTASQAGGLMLVQPLMQVCLTMKMGDLSDRMSDKRILPALGMTITAAGVSLYLLLGTTYSLPLVIAIMVTVGIGMGIFSAPNTSVILSSVRPELKGEASGMVAVVRQVGMMVSMAIAMTCISRIMGSADNLTPDRFAVFVDVIHVNFTICLAMCIIGAVCCLVKFENRTE